MCYIEIETTESIVVVDQGRICGFVRHMFDGKRIDVVMAGTSTVELHLNSVKQVEELAEAIKKILAVVRSKTDVTLGNMVISLK